MSAAQILAMQVGEVAGIQVLATLQQGMMHAPGADHARRTPTPLLATFHVPFLVGAALAGGRARRRGLLRSRRRAERLRAGTGGP